MVGSDVVADSLLSLGQLTRSTLADVSRGLGHPTQQVQLLCRLAAGSTSMGTLASALGLTRSSATELVDRAHARGLVSRRADPDDRRVQRVALTVEGEALAGLAHRAVGVRLAEATAVLTATERGQLVALVGRLVEASAGTTATDGSGVTVTP